MRNPAYFIFCTVVIFCLFSGHLFGEDIRNVGAQVLFNTFEAEELETNRPVVRMKGLPGPNEATPEIEASGRAYVELNSTGDYCEIKNAPAGNALILRYSIPDAPNGGGTTTTLSLYVNGEFRQKLSVDSHYNWLYGKVSSPHGAQNNDPKSGDSRLFWNDTRFLLNKGWNAGDRLRVQMDADDFSSDGLLDLVDVELAPPPLERPEENSLSIADYGATSNDETDDTAAIVACISDAKRRNKSVWLPPGTYHISDRLGIDGVRIQGAGMWHTQLIGLKASLGFRLSGKNPQVSDLYIESSFHHSRSDPDGMVFRSRGAEHFLVQNVWITHVHGGFWLGGASHGSICGCRVYGTYADAINLNSGSSHNIVEHNYIRTAGDDGIATLAEKKDERIVTSHNTFRKNTVIANWWGHNIDVAGGHGHVIEDNYLADNSHSGCFTFNLPSAYPMHPLTEAIVRRNTIVRGGGNHAGQERGAIWSFADDSPIAGVIFEENNIVAPIFRALHLHGSAKQDVVFHNNLIDSPGTDAIRIDQTVKGSLVLTNNTIRGLKASSQEVDNAADEGFELINTDTKLD
jgi:hypothetical protein